MQWRLLPTGLAALAAAGASLLDVPPELAVLARVRATTSETLTRQPNYTCVQQIERSRRVLPKRKFELHDLLRIEVALVDGKEMFAWPGARKFENTDLTEMVSTGAIGTGDFALHARSVFQTSAPMFKYSGRLTLRGRETQQFDFVVPLLSSGYHLKSGGREAIVGYHGSFWADARTGELLRLEVNADDIPESLGIGSVRDVMDYDHVRVGNSEFLLPLGSDLAMTDLAGNESRNRTQFKSCRQYSGESVLSFAEAPPDDAVEAAPAEPKAGVEAPEGIMLDVRLDSDIDSTSSAVGDPIIATLESPLKRKHQVLFAKGAVLFGRILRLERHAEYSIIDLEFTEIESGDSRSSVVAKLEEVILPGIPSQPTRSLFAQAQSRPPDIGVQIHGSRLHLPHGVRLRLRTMASRQSGNLHPQ